VTDDPTGSGSEGDPDGTESVYVRTDALPEDFADVQVPGVVWTYSPKQRAVVQVLRAAERP
jgi:coenzyme F420-reducing hydrogenase beta subunit